MIRKLRTGIDETGRRILHSNFEERIVNANLGE
jgi:hypothetical protein